MNEYMLEQRRQWVKVWKEKKKKKTSSPTSLRVNTWIVFHSLYLESSCLHFFLFQSRSISSTFLFPSQISADAFSTNFSLFLFVTLKFWLAIIVTFQVIFSVGYKSDFLSHIFGWLLECLFKSYFRVALEWLFKSYKRV